MSIEVGQDTAKLIEEELRSGHFRDAASLVDAALRHFLLERDLTEAYSREEVEMKIERGIASLERGEGVDGERFMADLVAELSESSKQGK